jgi:hypothetical protein
MKKQRKNDIFIFNKKQIKKGANMWKRGANMWKMVSNM